MTNITIEESGMTFGPFPQGRCYHIEGSECYKAASEGVKIAEFMLLREQEPGLVIWIVEAKSSSPAPTSVVEFREYIGDIAAKLTNTVILGSNAILGRHRSADEELPSEFQGLSLREVGYRLVLVINGHLDEWLPPISDMLNIAIGPIVRCLGEPVARVLVMNERKAKAAGLISNEAVE